MLPCSPLTQQPVSAGGNTGKVISENMVNAKDEQKQSSDSDPYAFVEPVNDTNIPVLPAQHRLAKNRKFSNISRDNSSEPPVAPTTTFDPSQSAGAVSGIVRPVHTNVSGSRPAQVNGPGTPTQRQSNVQYMPNGGAAASSRGHVISLPPPPPPPPLEENLNTSSLSVADKLNGTNGTWQSQPIESSHQPGANSARMECRQQTGPPRLHLPLHQMHSAPADVASLHMQHPTQQPTINSSHVQNHHLISPVHSKVHAQPFLGSTNQGPVASTNGSSIPHSTSKSPAFKDSQPQLQAFNNSLPNGLSRTMQSPTSKLSPEELPVLPPEELMDTRIPVLARLSFGRVTAKLPSSVGKERPVTRSKSIIQQSIAKQYFPGDSAFMAYAYWASRRMFHSDILGHDNEFEIDDEIESKKGPHVEDIDTEIAEMPMRSEWFVTEEELCRQEESNSVLTEMDANLSVFGKLSALRMLFF